MSNLQLSFDGGNLDNLESVLDTTRSINGIGGVSTIVPIQSTHEAFGYFWTREIMNAFVTSIWECDRVVAVKPHSMMNAWGSLNVSKGDRDQVDAVNKWMRGLRKKYCHGQMLANQYGGSTVVRLIDDGRLSDEPVDLENVKRIRYSRVFDRWECYPDPMSYLDDPTNPEYYLVTIDPSELIRFNSEVKTQSLTIKIHRDRIIRFDGEFLAAETMKQNQGWHASKLIRFLPPCLRYLEAMGYVASAMKSFEMVLFLVDDLFKMLSTPKGKEQVQIRARINQEMLNAVRGMMADRKTEDVKVVSRNFSNTDAVIEQLRKEMMGASGLDAIELFQEHPSGMAQTGQSQRLEKARQTKQLCEYHWGDLIEGNPTEEKIGDLELYLRSQMSPFKSEPDNYSWAWSEDVAVTPEEKSKIYVYYSQGDKNYKDSGAIAPIELRSRFDGDDFNSELILDDASFQKMNDKKTELTDKLVSTKSNPQKSEDEVEKLVIDPIDNILLTESEFERFLSEVENLS